MTPEQYKAKYGDAKIMVIPKKAILYPQTCSTNGCYRILNAQIYSIIR